MINDKRISWVPCTMFRHTQPKYGSSHSSTLNSNRNLAQHPGLNEVVSITSRLQSRAALSMHQFSLVASTNLSKQVERKNNV